MADEGVIIKTEHDPLSESATLPAVKKEVESDEEIATKLESEPWDADCDEQYSVDCRSDIGQHMSQADTVPLTVCEAWPIMSPEEMKIKLEPGLMEDETSMTNDELGRVQSVEVGTEDENKDFLTDFGRRISQNETTPFSCIGKALIAMPGQTNVKLEDGLTNDESFTSKRHVFFKVETEDKTTGLKNTIMTVEVPVTNMNETQRVQCVDKPFSSAQIQNTPELNSHSQSQPVEKRFSCEKCLARFTTKGDLKRHSQFHSDERPFSCGKCSAQFKIKSHLKQHSVIHSNERPFSCERCSAQFKTKGKLRDHLQLHSDEKPFACAECSARFKRKSNLNQHSLTHSNERPFSCEKCSARFKTKRDLKTHSQSHSDERRFSCEMCSAQFKTKGDLKSHSLCHSDVRLFSCSKCLAQFLTKAELNLHIRSHFDEKPFHCDQCSAQFKCALSLKLHLESHVGTDLLSCEWCSARFNSKSHLSRHTLTHFKI